MSMQCVRWGCYLYSHVACRPKLVWRGIAPLWFHLFLGQAVRSVLLYELSNTELPPDDSNGSQTATSPQSPHHSSSVQFCYHVVR